MTAPAPHDYATDASTPLLFGREREQTLLRAWLSEAIHGRGRLALIGGEAGIGKSALAAWLTAEARGQAVATYTGRCDDVAQTPPYGPWRDVLTRLKETAAGFPFHAGSGDGLESVSSQSALFAEVAACLGAAASARPLVIVLEDLHWADPASLELLRFVARRIDEIPLLAIGTYRADELSPRQPLFDLLPPLARDPRTERIDLGPLPTEAVRSLLRARYPLPPPDEARLAAFLQERASGNPFYLTESLRALESACLLRRHDDRWELGSLEAAPVPPLVRQIVESRLAGFDAETLRLLEIAAVIGQTAPLDLWQPAAAANRERLLGAAEGAADARLARVLTSPASLVFAHALVRDTLYARQPLGRRQVTHRRIAEILVGRPDTPPSLVASHFTAADDPRAIDWLVRSGEQALALYAARDAVTALTRAQELASRFTRSLPPTAYRARAKAAALLGEFDRARRDLELAVDQGRVSGDREAAWQALLDLGMLWAERDYERTIGFYRAALALARETGDDRTIAYSLNRVANWHVNREEPEIALPLHQEALSLFRARGDQAGIADTLDFLGMASYLNADFRHATHYCEEAATLFRAQDDRERLSSCLVLLAVSGGDVMWIAPPLYREARSWLGAAEEAVKLAQAIGWPAGEAFARICLGMVTLSRGNLGRALREAELGRAIAERIGHEQWLIAAQQTIGSIWAELLSPDRAVPVLERALASARVTGSRFWTYTNVAVLASLLVAEGELTRAAALLGTAFPAGSGHRSLSLRQCRFAEAELRLAEGDAEQSLAIVDELIKTRPHPMPDDAMPHLMKLRGDALARLGRPDDAEATYQAAATSARLLEFRPVLWRIEQARGDVFAGQGRTGEAEEAFQRARAVVDELAATIDDPALRETFRSRARARLPLGAPARPGEPARGLLSPREREILRQLVEGKSDREIAAALYISHRTAMRHVASILRKLGVTSRTAAATLAVRNEIV